ncbi:MAG: helix-turn-helix domain-containing protein [Proteobacteria bacterium]|nr:helix-turn-helix domain-containing protein [Pseudomonadota bacterium]MBU1058816.1 helix-turn-helix domain-containing protein [Pseudomonadota bacterium]
MKHSNENSIKLLKGIGSRMRKVRIEKKITQAELADRAGISRKVIGRMEHGDGSVTLEKWLKVSMVLEVGGTWEHLFKIEEDPFIQYDREQKEQTDLWKKRVRSKK